MIAFVLWAAAGGFLMVLGVHALLSSKPAAFWANTEPPKIKDIKGYNRAVGRLFIAYGAVFILLGLPLVLGQNKALILLSVLGVMLETIAAMAVYSIRITGKYKSE